MLIQVHTDRNISGGQTLADRVEAIVRDALDRFGERVTRVEAHLSDENSRAKSGAADKRCLLEARLAGLAPIAVSHEAPELEQAITGAAAQLQRALENALGRLADR